MANSVKDFVIENYSSLGIECSGIGDGFVFLTVPPRIQNFDQVIEELKSRFGATVDVELDSATGVSDVMLLLVTTGMLTMLCIYFLSFV